MKKLTSYWCNEYLDNWKMHEKRLNEFPHYKIEVHALSMLDCFVDY